MKKLKGQFFRWEDEPAAGATLELRLSQDAKASDGTRVEGGYPIEITLDDSGRIPPGTRIHANDELLPPGTFYTVFFHDDDDPNNGELSWWYKIEGKSPIDLKRLTPLEEAPALIYPLLTDEDFLPPPPPLPPRTPRKPGSTANHIGFYGVTVHAPANTDSTSLPSLHAGGFGVQAFTLPFAAVVGCGRIIVDEAGEGSEVILGLYDADRNRVLTQRIGVKSPGVATGVFHAPVELQAGDYYLAWAINRSSEVSKPVLLRSIKGDFRFGTHGRAAGRELPTILGDIQDEPVEAPVVYFEAW